MRFFLSVLALGLALGGTNGLKSCNRTSIRCETKDDDEQLEKDFQPACIAYEACLDCGVIFGNNQTICDNLFLKELSTICLNTQPGMMDSFSFDRVLCPFSSHAYFTRKLVFPTRAVFKNRSEEYCYEPWVAYCILL